ncbi:MMPL family transporter [Pseudoxanthomonas winnipegensis]|uniref:MMPL family transporter n=1 Tax=Pseudoxanthomonas winnipegensis TaxID=2480810 RepID=UPI0013EE84F5|nr:MMPL family transporter [Pseudoxanthomonas winnipegensis]
MSLPPVARTGLALLWLALLLALGAWIGSTLKLSGDLRKFMPEARTPAQKLLLDELGEGPGSRLLLLALSGSDQATLAAQSKALRARLASQREAISMVANGDVSPGDAIPAKWLPYRFLLTDRYDAHPLDAATLHAELAERVQDLGSPAAEMIEPMLPRDPTLELLYVAQRLQPASTPQLIDGVWFDKAGKRALLVVETVAGGFDPSGQQQAVGGIRAAFEAVAKGSTSQLLLTGPGAFSVEISTRTQNETQWIGMLDTGGLILLLLIAYRSWKIPLLGVLPLASAGLVGMVAVMLCFEQVHGITLAFGFTLIGVVQDYPIHLFSHQRPGLSPYANARHLWPTLATGVVSTCIAYVTFFFSGVEGLRQLAVFTICGLGGAALLTRLLLPALIDPSPRDYADSRLMARLFVLIDRLPRPRWSLLGLAVVAAVVIVASPTPFWQDDLSKLTPVPRESLMQDGELRSELGAPDVMYVLSLQAPDRQAALAASSALRTRLDAQVAAGNLASYDMAARYLPTIATQRKRQAQLPAPEAARAMLEQATAGLPFRSDVFAPFLADLEHARTARPLDAPDLADTPLATGVQGLLLEGEGHTTALVSLSGLRDPAALTAALAGTGAQLMDLREASRTLVLTYHRVLVAMGVAAVLLAIAVSVSLRERRRIVRVLLPMGLSVLLILAVLRGAGVELNLFHLISLILGAGLGLDYALFFDHAGDDAADQRRTLHALIVCSLMTLLVFVLLGLSSIPVLRAIGSTVAMGVVFNFVLALLVSREHARGDDAPGAQAAAHG